jgi:5'-3' exoribonuclease 1
MGIPSYFSYIVKRHKDIIKQIVTLPCVHNLYMDCNSIVYDAVRTCSPLANRNISDYETELISNVCLRIEEYIQKIRPQNKVLIAFDGVAPVAKLNQQRERRYKSWFTSVVEERVNEKDRQRNGGGEKPPRAWNTSSITPGTNFMKKLNEHLHFHFSRLQLPAVEPAVGSAEIILSTSERAGEGEHKIFEYVRLFKEYHSETTTVIYGLDADLIMLTLNHLHISKRLYLYRDTPEFIQSLDSDLSPKEDYYLDIPLFATCLKRMMKDKIMGDDDSAFSAVVTPMDRDNGIIDDYIFLCFFLGNDFMPHFPALNLRTQGMDILMQKYIELFGDTNERLVIRDSTTKEQCIQWKNVRKFISSLADDEHGHLIQEHKLRTRQARHFGYQHTNAHHSTTTTPTSANGSAIQPTSMKNFMSIPLQDRSLELYIDPFRPNWEYRYYDCLFDIQITPAWSREICTNYLEGLEWTLKYYSTGCIDWRWTYKYPYAPLLSDLKKYVPVVDALMLQVKPKDPINELVQLCYVLPLSSHGLLHPDVAKRLRKHCLHYYEENLEFKWAYCKYFWEAHTDLPLIHIPDLEAILFHDIPSPPKIKSMPIPISK